jgi:hypothetical protein
MQDLCRAIDVTSGVNDTNWKRARELGLLYHDADVWRVYFDKSCPAFLSSVDEGDAHLFHD